MRRATVLIGESGGETGTTRVATCEDTETMTCGTNTDTRLQQTQRAQFWGQASVADPPVSPTHVSGATAATRSVT